MKKITPSSDDLGQRLDRYLRKVFPGAKLGEIYEALRTKKITIGGKKLPESTKLREGDILDIDINEALWKTWRTDPSPLIRGARGVSGNQKLDPTRILFQDKDIIVYDKPAGLIVHSPDHKTDEVSLIEQIEDYLTNSGWKPSGTFLHPALAHRIDRDTSGIIISCLNRVSYEYMAEQFRTRKVEKTYHALVAGVPESREGTINAPLLRLDNENTHEAKVIVDPRGQGAETSYRVLQIFSPDKGENISPLIRGARGVPGIKNINLNNRKYDHIPYTESLTKKAQENRGNATSAENTLWFDILKVGELAQYKFTRQKPLLTYIVDAYCSAIGLVIEVDGDTHAEQEIYDIERTKNLEKYGLKVLRYTNHEILTNTEGVYEDIQEKIKIRQKELNLKNHQTPHPPLSGGSYSLVELHPKTGRTHQIRVHMAHIGHPLIGDRRYAGPSVTKFPELNHLHSRRGHLLHAEKIEFTHPNGKALQIQSNSNLLFCNSSGIK